MPSRQLAFGDAGLVQGVVNAGVLWFFWVAFAFDGLDVFYGGNDFGHRCLREPLCGGLQCAFFGFVPEGADGVVSLGFAVDFCEDAGYFRLVHGFFSFLSCLFLYVSGMRFGLVAGNADSPGGKAPVFPEPLFIAALLLAPLAFSPFRRFPALLLQLSFLLV